MKLFNSEWKYFVKATLIVLVAIIASQFLRNAERVFRLDYLPILLGLLLTVTAVSLFSTVKQLQK
ncbi:MAG: hypothetical protein JNM95_14050 [Chitinophagaceae bacterium]|nr:hypothetical protein [Chitinophagaceae bacterium]